MYQTPPSGSGATSCGRDPDGTGYATNSSSATGMGVAATAIGEDVAVEVTTGLVPGTAEVEVDGATAVVGAMAMDDPVGDAEQAAAARTAAKNRVVRAMGDGCGLISDLLDGGSKVVSRVTWRQCLAKTLPFRPVKGPTPEQQLDV